MESEEFVIPKQMDCTIPRQNWLWKLVSLFLSDLKDVVGFRCVCKYFHTISQKDKCFPCVSVWNRKQWNITKEQWLTIMRYVTNLTFTTFDLLWVEQMDFISMTTNVRRLTLTSTMTFENLKRLDLSPLIHCNYLCLTGVDCPDIIFFPPHLEVLLSHACYSMSIYLTCTSLRYLSLYGHSLAGTKAVENIATLYPALQLFSWQFKMCDEYQMSWFTNNMFPAGLHVRISSSCYNPGNITHHQCKDDQYYVATADGLMSSNKEIFDTHSYLH